MIRLCIGIEDPEDLLDDLESALLEAGAIRVMDEAGAGGKRMLERVYRAKLTDDEIQNAGSCLVVSAPGKVILFGEHAVVHGIVSRLLIYDQIQRLCKLTRRTTLIDCDRGLTFAAMLLSRTDLPSRLIVSLFSYCYLISTRVVVHSFVAD